MSEMRKQAASLASTLVRSAREHRKQSFDLANHGLHKTALNLWQLSRSKIQEARAYYNLAHYGNIEGKK